MFFQILFSDHIKLNCILLSDSSTQPPSSYKLFCEIPYLLFWSYLKRGCIPSFCPKTCSTIPNFISSLILVLWYSQNQHFCELSCFFRFKIIYFVTFFIIFISYRWLSNFSEEVCFIVKYRPEVILTFFSLIMIKEKQKTGFKSEQNTFP